MEIVLNSKRYSGSKVSFNSRKGTGMLIEGVVIKEVPELNVVLLRDKENFLHAVSIQTIKEI